MISHRINRKENSGFTLVEMIISVAFLAIISVILVQLFISAKNVSLKAHDLDQSVNVSKKVIAAFKSCKEPDDLLNSPLLIKADIAVSDDAAEYRMYFDEGWNVLDKQDKQLQEQTAFLATIIVKPVVEEADSHSENSLYRIQVRVQKIKPYLMETKTESELFTITSDKYFGGTVKD